MGKRLHIAPGKQVVHHGVAYKDDLGNFLLAPLCETHNYFPERSTHNRGQVVAMKSRANPIHHIRSERGLRIELGLDTEDATRGQIDDLRSNRSRAQIDGDAQAMFARANHAGIIREHIHVPLAALKHQWRLRARLARKPPATCELFCRESLPVRIRNRQPPGQHANAATAAQTRSSARKLDAMIRET
jgi:uncharacterized SAM-dependent methyltransferase